MFTYRLCPDAPLVQKFLSPTYLPTESEKAALEACFQSHILPCTSVPGQSCDYNPDCSPGQPCWRNDWFTCKGFNSGDQTKCRGVDNAPINSCYTSIAGGYTVSKKVRIPSDWPQSNHTLLGFKWNSWQTPQVYLGCADIAVVGSSPPPSSSSSPSVSSSPSPTACATPVASVTVTFSQKVKTVYGESIRVVGSVPQLGSWDASKGKVLSAAGYTDANPVWSGSVVLPAGAAIEYKFVRVSSQGVASWESDPNRRYTVPKGCGSAVSVAGEWR